jgi:hypothetical protein
MTEDFTNEEDFSVEDSTEQFELENDINNDYEPDDLDFDDANSTEDNSDSEVQTQDSEVSDSPDYESPSSTPMAEPTTASINAEQGQPEQKTPSSFRVMRYEDFLSKSAD